MDRRTYLTTTSAAAAGIGGLAGCIGDDPTGTLSTQVTDQPGDIGDFESCILTIEGVWLGPDDAEAGGEEGEEPSGREYHEYDEPQTADLVELQDEATRLVDERELDVATYEFLQLEITGIDATLEDGGSADVQLPGEAPLTFGESFEIREDTRTLFTADCMPVRRGQADGYVLRPVAEGTTVEYDESE